MATDIVADSESEPNTQPIANPPSLSEGTLESIPFSRIDPHSPNLRWPGLNAPIWDQFPEPSEDSAEAQAWRALQQSIQAQGILQPPHVMRPSEPDGLYRLLWGFRRTVAAYHLAEDPEATTLQVLVHERLDESVITALQWVENAHRTKLQWAQTAAVVKQLHEAGWSQTAIAARLGISSGLAHLYGSLAQSLQEYPDLKRLTGQLLGPTHVQRIIRWSETAWSQDAWKSLHATPAERQAIREARQREVIDWLVGQLEASLQTAPTPLPRGWIGETLDALERKLQVAKAPTNPKQALKTSTWATLTPPPKAFLVAPWLAQTQRVQAVDPTEIAETLQGWNPEDLAELRQSVTALQQILNRLAEPKAEDEGEETPENSQ